MPLFATTKPRQLDIRRVAAARVAFSEKETADGLPIQAGEPYWWTRDFATDAVKRWARAPGRDACFTSQGLHRSEQILAIITWLEGLDTRPEEHTPTSIRDVAESAYFAENMLHGYAGEYAEFLDTLIAQEGGALWHATDRMVSGLEDVCLSFAADELQAIAAEWEAAVALESAGTAQEQEAKIQVLKDHVRARLIDLKDAAGTIPVWTRP